MKNIFFAGLIFFSYSYVFGEQSSIELNQSLEKKIRLFHENLEATQKKFLDKISDERVPLNERLVGRDQWEKWLVPSPDAKVSDNELSLLKSRQMETILRNKTFAEKNSLFDFDKLRTDYKSGNKEYLQKFCKEVPKGGMLHIHPFGTFSRSFVRSELEISERKIDLSTAQKNIENSNGNAILYDSEKKWINNFNSKYGNSKTYSQLEGPDQLILNSFLFLPSGKHVFERFNSVFSFLDLAVSDLNSYERALLDFSKRALKANVSYVEFTTSGSERFIELVKKIEQSTGLIIRINRSFNRTQSNEDLYKQVTGFLKSPISDYIVGIDLLDNEGRYSALDRAQFPYGLVLAREKTKDSGFNAASQQQKIPKIHRTLRRTMHAGELGDSRNVRDALIMGAERIGHGVLLAADPLTLEYAANKKIPIEVNLVSNLKLTNVDSISDHPFLNFLRLGLSVSLSTDDEGIFDTNIENECQLAIKHTDLNYFEFKKMSFNSIETSFADDSLKSLLIKRLNEQFASFEKTFAQ